MLRKGMSVMC